MNLRNSIKHNFLLLYGCKIAPEPFRPLHEPRIILLKQLAAVLYCLDSRCVYVCTGLYDFLFVCVNVIDADLKAHKLLESPVTYQCTYFMYVVCFFV